MSLRTHARRFVRLTQTGGKMFSGIVYYFMHTRPRTAESAHRALGVTLSPRVAGASPQSETRQRNAATASCTRADKPPSALPAAMTRTIALPTIAPSAIASTSRT